MPEGDEVTVSGFYTDEPGAVFDTDLAPAATGGIPGVGGPPVNIVVIDDDAPTN